MTNVEFDLTTFQKRLSVFIEQWKSSVDEPDSGFNGAKSIVVANDTPNDEIQYSKTSTIQNWLFGYEFSKTLIILTLEKMVIATSNSKAKILSKLSNIESPIPVEIFSFDKSEKETLLSLSKAASFLKENSDEPIGAFVKDKKEGNFVKLWSESKVKAKIPEDEVDVSAGVALILSQKDDAELKMMTLASKASSLILKNYFLDIMTSAIDQDLKITHEALAEKTEKIIFKEKEIKKIKLPSEVDITLLDWCYTPIIQSGGNYNLKPSAFSDDKNLSSGVIICSVGIRYNGYCSNIGRTFLIDATPNQEKNYSFLLELQKHVVSKIKPGVSFKDAYSSATKFIQSNRPELANHFTKNIGFVTGIEFRESSLIIQSKSSHVFAEGMVVCLSIGFHQIVDNKSQKKYSLLINNTISVSGDSAAVLTNALSEATDITYFLNNDAPEKSNGNAKKKNEGVVKTTPAKTAILKSKFRSEDQEETPEQKRREHQRELFQEKQEESLRRFKGDANAFKNPNTEQIKTFESYKRESALPKEAKNLGIFVDKRGESIIVPINGMAVPFHISTLKNASKNDEGEYVYIRLNFVTPGAAVGKKDDLPFSDPSAHFLRALTFRSTDTFRLSEIYKNILDLKKEIAKKEIEKKDLADIIQQDKLKLSDGRVSRLSDVFIRPPPEGKRMAGELEIHSNGLRYKHPRANQNIDVLFSNTKHLFFQPCENELLVIIHLHLIDPIMIGKKKTKDVQFYREASDVQFDETGNRRRFQLYGDEDEIDAEMEERQRIRELNQEFKTFSSKISDATRNKIEVETPFREIGFNGVPSRSNVLLMPTGDCLVHLSDPPFLIISLAEVELVHMERVQFGLKNFDIVFIFKDFNRSPIQINTVPMKQLDGVKEWLDSVDVIFTEGPVNLNWNPIMKMIREDPISFFEDGGWSFLGDKEDSGEPSEESASEFEIDSEELMETEESDIDSEEESNQEESAASEEADSEEIDDWDELEEKAAKDDKQKRVLEPQPKSVPKKKRR